MSPVNGLQDFDAARRERARGKDPIRFRLGGETFECLAVVPGGGVLDLIAGERTDPYSAQRRFLSVCLRDDDGTDERESSFVRMTSLLYRREDPVDIDAVVEVVAWIAEVYSGRPTVPSSGSSDGRSNDGEPSKVTSLSEIHRDRASTG